MPLQRNSKVAGHGPINLIQKNVPQVDLRPLRAPPRAPLRQGDDCVPPRRGGRGIEGEKR